MKCFYHTDADGMCSGFWVKKCAKHTDKYKAECIPIDYRKKFPIENIQPDEQVFIVDYSIEPEEMTKLLNITPHVVWIDHHKSSIDKYTNYPVDIMGLRYNGIAACMLTYIYFKFNQYTCDMSSHDAKVAISSAPMFTKLIADWDTFTFKYGDNTKNFQIAFYAYDFSPESINWDYFKRPYNSFEDDLIDEGKIMQKYKVGWNKKYLEAEGFETTFEGYNCFALNIGMGNSTYFDSLPKDKYDILIPFCFNGDLFKVSLYSKSLNVLEIAKKYGGGGHEHACGFQCEKLPFKKNKD